MQNKNECLTKIRLADGSGEKTSGLEGLVESIANFDLKRAGLF